MLSLNRPLLKTALFSTFALTCVTALAQSPPPLVLTETPITTNSPIGLTVTLGGIAIGTITPDLGNSQTGVQAWEWIPPSNSIVTIPSPTFYLNWLEPEPGATNYNSVEYTGITGRPGLALNIFSDYIVVGSPSDNLFYTNGQVSPYAVTLTDTLTGTVIAQGVQFIDQGDQSPPPLVFTELPGDVLTAHIGTASVGTVALVSAPGAAVQTWTWTPPTNVLISESSQPVGLPVNWIEPGNQQPTTYNQVNVVYVNYPVVGLEIISDTPDTTPETFPDSTMVNCLSLLNTTTMPSTTVAQGVQFIDQGDVPLGQTNCPPAPLILFNTGVNTNGVLLAGGSVDPNFTLTTNANPGGGSQAYVVYSNDIPGGWLTNDALSQWISPWADGGASESSTVGTFAYQITFNVPCTNNAVVNGVWAVDNNGAILLNGNPTPVATLTGGGSGNFTALHSFTITSGLVAGLNTLTFYVTNSGAETGLRVELTGSATCCNCLQVDCATNKTVQCGSGWTFDPPTGSSCCGSNLTTTILSTVTNSGTALITFNGGGSVAYAVVDFDGTTATSGYLDITAGPAVGSYPLTPGAGSNQYLNWDGQLFVSENTFVDGEGLLFTGGGFALNLYDFGPGSYGLGGTPHNGTGPSVTNGVATIAVCPKEITRTWLLTDACGNTTTCGQKVTVVDTNPPVINCVSSKTVQCGTAWSFDAPTAYDACSGSNVVITVASTVTNGVNPQVITQTWLATDACGNTNTCSQVVTVLACVTNQCCGPGLGAQTIQWLQLPTSGPGLNPDPSGVNGSDTWILTNLPCYGNVLITQDAPANALYTAFTKDNPELDNPLGAYGTFPFTEAEYGPYFWGTIPGTFGMYNTTPSTNLSYNVNIYFLDGQPNPCNLVLAVIGIGEYTTVTASQLITFRTEYDLSANSGNPASAYTTLNGNYGSSLSGVSVIGTLVASAYSLDGYGDIRNTGLAIFQPNNYLMTTTVTGIGPGWPGPGGPAWPILPANANVPVPYLTLTISAQNGDGFGVTVGYICCSNNCLQVDCATNKTVQCGSAWTFDPPSASSCCGSNVTVTSTGTVTNGVALITFIGGGTTADAVVDFAGNTATGGYLTITAGSQMGTYPLLPGTGSSTLFEWDNLIFPSANPFLDKYGLFFTGNGSEFNLYGYAGSYTLAGAPPTYSPYVTNGAATITVCPQVITRTWQITDTCGNSNTCSQTVTVNSTPPTIICEPYRRLPLNANCQLVIPAIRVSATDNCTPASRLVYTQSPAAGTIVSERSQVVTVTVTDTCGLTSSCEVTVVGVSRTGPVVICPTNVVATNCLVPCVPVTATSSCCAQSSLEITQNPPCGDLIGSGVNSITVTVTDCYGNFTTKVVSLTVGGPGSFLSALFNTGVGGGGLLPDDAVDTHYTLPSLNVHTIFSMPSDYFSNAVAVSGACQTGFPICPGFFNDPGFCYQWTPWTLPPLPGSSGCVSKWIAPNYTNNGCDPAGTYTYTLQFNLGGFDPTTATISGRWVADNAAGMYLNSGLVAVTKNGKKGDAGFKQWAPFTIPAGSGFMPGANTLTFIVTNDETWTGLRVEFTNAFSGCATCAPPTIISGVQPLFPGGPSLRPFWASLGSKVTLGVNAGGTPPLSYQWYLNNVELGNNGDDSDVNTSAMLVNPFMASDAGTYSVVISNACGLLTGYVSVQSFPQFSWNWGWWDVPVLANPLGVTVGPDLNLVGSSVATNYSITAGTTEDFALPEVGGQIVNVMHIDPQSEPSIQVPVIAPSGSNSVNSYTVILDLYEPDTSLGTPSTLFQSLACCLGSGQDGVSLSLDGQNDLHLTGSAAGVPFDAASAAPLPVDAWNRVALVIDDPQDGFGINGSIYLNGQPVASLTVPTPVGLPIDWGNSPPTVLSVQTNAVSPNAEFYVASIQFHAVALAPQVIAGMGSPDDGPALAFVNSTAAPPALSATVSNGLIKIAFSGGPFVLQETTDLSSGIWANSALSFTQSQVNGSIITTYVANPATDGPAKFYRLAPGP
jgi:hypothetical protein